MAIDMHFLDWVVQYDPPDDPRDFIHRVGRTARGSGSKGKALLFLQPSEVGFLSHLKQARVPVVEYAASYQCPPFFPNKVGLT
jgi:ATP-dependent RNA helicase DDX18/HAS1